MHTFLESTTRSMIEDSHVASVVTDSDGNIQYINSAAESVLGLEHALWQSRSLSELILSQGNSSLDVDLGSIRGGSVVGEQLINLNLEGRNQAVWLNNHPVYRGEDCVGIIWHLRALQETAEHGVGDIGRFQRYRSLFNQAALPQFVLDITAAYAWVCQHRVYSPDALDQLLESRPGLVDELRGLIDVEELNEAAAGLSNGLQASELTRMGRKIATIADVKQLALVAIAIYQGKPRLEYPYQYTAPDGNPRNMLAVSALPGPDHIDQGVLVSLLDITDLKETQADLRARERFLSATLLAVPDLLIVYDFEEHRPLFINDAVSRHLGHEWQTIEDLGSDFTRQLLHPEDQLKPGEFEDQRLRMALGDIIERPIRMRHANGEWKQFESRSASLDDFNGLARIGVILARDVTEQMMVRETIDKHERRYRLLAENFSDIICTLDEELNTTYISPSCERLLGYSPDEMMAMESSLRRKSAAVRELHKTLKKDVNKASAERRYPQLQSLDYLRLLELEMTHKEGYPVNLEVQCSLMWDEAGGLQGLLLVCRDITARAEVEADRRLAAKVFENSLEGIFITDAEGKITQVNRAFIELTGYSEEQVLGERPSILAVDSRQVSFQNVIKPILDSAGFWQGELWSRRKNGSEFPSAVGITSVLGKGGEFLGYITSFRDITERKSTEERIRKLAYFDPLTGLPNRSLFLDRLNQELQRALRNNSYVVLLFLDLDRFKSVNDSMGHAAGDALLGKIAERLSACVRGNDSIARMGGDEFTLILSDLKERPKAVAAAVSVARKIMEVLADPIILHGREVFLSASIGVAIYPEDGDDTATLLKHADVAMYHAKQAGKNNYQFYVEAMNAKALEKLELQNGLYRAAVNHDFRVMYQPITDLATGKVIAVESLLRWNHPARGTIGPTEFVPVAEESGLIVRIGQWVLQEACQQMAVWVSQGYTLEWIAVNISARQFAEGNLVRNVVSALEESALPAHFLELELTESILMNDVSYTLEVLNELKGMDVELAIDDFGTGYSSLNYLKQFPIDRLKIDRSFIQNLPDDVEDQRITQAIVAIAHSFNLSVIAEGVEKPEQAEFLTQQGCESAQGYYFGRPMTAEDLGNLLQSQREDESATAKAP